MKHRVHKSDESEAAVRETRLAILQLLALRLEGEERKSPLVIFRFTLLFSTLH